MNHSAVFNLPMFRHLCCQRKENKRKKQARDRESDLSILPKPIGLRSWGVFARLLGFVRVAIATAMAKGEGTHAHVLVLVA
jgi:hypothetical protein